MTTLPEEPMPSHIAGITPDEMQRAADRLHALRDQTMAKLMGWIVLGNSGAFAFCVSQLIADGAFAEAMKRNLIISAWIFALGISLGIVAAFNFAKGMGDFAQNAQETLRAYRRGESIEEVARAGKDYERAGDDATKVVGWTAVFSAACFLIGLAGALASATRLA